MIEFDDELLRAKSLCETEPDEAMRICSDVMTREINTQKGQMALFMTGYIMMQAERYGLAYHIYERCAQLNPEVSQIYSNMGMCLEDHDPDRAIELFKHAYHLDPKNSHAMANEGLIYLQTGRPEKCIKLCDMALEIEPNLRSAIHNKGLAKIMLREWKEGWKLYYDTLGVKHREKRNYGLPEWNGEPGKVLVYGEQGVGDEIMFSSCLEDLSKTNQIVLDCDSRLESLFKRSFDFPVYGTRFKKEALWVEKEKPDYQCAIGQLPHFYRNKEADFPGKPFLKVDPERSFMWKSLFDKFPGDKVGIAWRGGLPHTGEKKRSLELSDFNSLFDKTLISLEYKTVEKDSRIKSFPETLKGRSIDDLASIIVNLDYIVTCCTTVVYVAGALGVPCYVLVPNHPGYRYHKKGNFPWFKSVQLIRKDGSWRSTIDKNLHRFRPQRDGGVSRSLSVNFSPIKQTG